MDHNVHRATSHARSGADTDEQAFHADGGGDSGRGHSTGRNDSRAGDASQGSVSHDDSAATSGSTEHAKGGRGRRTALRVVDVDGINNEAGSGGRNRDFDDGGVSRGGIGTDTLGKAKDGQGVNLGHVSTL